MSQIYVAIDGGTTNTRIVLVDDTTTIIDREKIPIGAGETVKTGSNSSLNNAVKSALQKVLERNRLTPDSLAGIFASGMICSELGIHCVPHIPAPADISTLAKARVTVTIPEITPLIPITFIPGLKCTGDSPTDTEIMRGEETEAVGIYHLANCHEPFVLLLPGTHNKIIFIGKNGVIERFFTAISGELTKCVSDHTILKSSLEGGYSKNLDEAYLLDGYDKCEKSGLTGALFKIRTYSKFTDTSAEQLYAYLVGVVLHEDIKLLKSVMRDAPRPIIVAGSEPFKTALCRLILNRTEFSLFFDQKNDEDLFENSAVYGALSIGKTALSYLKT